MYDESTYNKIAEFLGIDRKSIIDICNPMRNKSKKVYMVTVQGKRGTYMIHDINGELRRIQ